MTLDPEEIAQRFRHHPPVLEGVGETHALVRTEVRRLAATLDVLLPDGRDKSLALTALEDVMMRANRSVAMNEVVLHDVEGALESIGSYRARVEEIISSADEFS